MTAITLYYSPQTRATGTRVLLEELGAPYELHVLNMKAGENRQAPYLAINPLGKVPALRHGDAFVTEQIAIGLYLADLFPEAGLTPAIGDPARGNYLRWMVYYAACFEPAVIDKALNRPAIPQSQSAYSDYDTMIATLEAQLAKGPYLLGERMTAADILWGMALSWTTMFGLVPKTPVIMDYVARMTARPAFVAIGAADEVMAAEHQAAVVRAAGGV